MKKAQAMKMHDKEIADSAEDRARLSKYTQTVTTEIRQATKVVEKTIERMRENADRATSLKLVPR